MNVDYLPGGDLAFFKKVSFAGITADNKLFTREITFRYPTTTSNLAGVEQLGRCGNLELRRLDEDVIKTLAKFTTVFVQDDGAKEFIKHYVTSHSKIINIEACNFSEQE